jgi:hypothetical protein
MKANKVL